MAPLVVGSLIGLAFHSPDKSLSFNTQPVTTDKLVDVLREGFNELK